MAATGGAIAAVRAVMWERIEKGDARETTLFIGVAQEADLPLTHELQAWRREGIAVIVCTSRATIEDETHAHGYVQDVARKRLRSAAKTPLLLVGHAKMIEGMRDVAKEKDLIAYVNV
jgi:NAD(P)H-flavin reductase